MRQNRTVIKIQRVLRAFLLLQHLSFELKVEISIRTNKYLLTFNDFNAEFKNGSVDNIVGGSIAC
jgi:hypothetical protein